MNPRNDRQTRRYAFGPLEFGVVGLGVFTGHDNLRARIQLLTKEEAKQANSAAWKQRKTATRIANRQCNVSRYGWDDARDQLIEVAEVVCRETWKRIQG